MKTEQELDLSGLRELLAKATPELLSISPTRMAEILEKGCRNKRGLEANYTADGVVISTLLREVPALLSRTEQAEAAVRAWQESCAEEVVKRKAAETSLKERDEEVARLRLAMLGGEDVPGLAMSLTLEDVLSAYRDNERLLRERAEAAEAALERIKAEDHDEFAQEGPCAKIARSALSHQGGKAS